MQLFHNWFRPLCSCRCTNTTLTRTLPLLSGGHFVPTHTATRQRRIFFFHPRQCKVLSSRKLVLIMQPINLFSLPLIARRWLTYTCAPSKKENNTGSLINLWHSEIWRKPINPWTPLLPLLAALVPADSQTGAFQRTRFWEPVLFHFSVSKPLREAQFKSETAAHLAL